MSTPNQTVPPGRKARVAALQMWSDLVGTKEENVLQALALIDEAAQFRPDIMALPENVPTLAHQGVTYLDVAEPVPGPLTERLAAKARAYQCYILFPMIELLDGKPYNSAVLFGRNGDIVGTYHKVHEPEAFREAWGAQLGKEFPVFDLDVGRIGVMICWDNTFPETAAILALKGAEIIFFPHLLGLPNPLNFAVTTRARAVDNCVYVVAIGIRTPGSHSGHQEGIYPTCIIHRDGSILCQAEETKAMVICHELDLATPHITRGLGRWGETDWRAQRLQERRPPMYGALCEKSPGG